MLIPGVFAAPVPILVKACVAVPYPAERRGISFRRGRFSGGFGKLVLGAEAIADTELGD